MRSKIPETTKDKLLEAITQFDLEIRNSKEMLGWENNLAHKYAIKHSDQLYPVKKIISIATGAPVSEFSGGWKPGDANRFVEQYGFSVIPLSQQYPFASYSWVMYSPTVAVKEMDKSSFLHHGTGVPKDIAFYFDFKPDDEAKAVWLWNPDDGFLAPLAMV
jgi:hypothetical protein